MGYNINDVDNTQRISYLNSTHIGNTTIENINENSKNSCISDNMAKMYTSNSASNTQSAKIEGTKCLSGIAAIIGFVVAGIVAAAILKYEMTRRNKKRREEKDREGKDREDEDEEEDRRKEEEDRRKDEERREEKDEDGYLKIDDKEQNPKNKKRGSETVI